MQVSVLALKPAVGVSMPPQHRCLLVSPQGSMLLVGLCLRRWGRAGTSGESSGLVPGSSGEEPGFIPVTSPHAASSTVVLSVLLCPWTSMVLF